MHNFQDEFEYPPKILEQQAVCQRFGAEFQHADPIRMIGVARNIYESKLFPINGLRHPPDGKTTGWYIWRGEELSTEDDFFQPLHVIHLHRICPEIIPYLGLASGWQFLLAPGYEDVWYDETLLDIEPLNPNESNPTP